MFAGKIRFACLASVKEKKPRAVTAGGNQKQIYEKKLKSFLEIRYKGIGFSLYTKKLVVKFLLYRLIFDTHFYIRIQGDKS